MSGLANIGVGLAILAFVVGSSLIKEPTGWRRGIFKVLFGPLAFSGDGTEPPSSAAKAIRSVVTAALVLAAGYCLYEGLR